MKSKHNKKRNSAFVYEALIREATVAILKKDSKRRQTAINLIRTHFKEDSLLRQDLECHRSLYENQNLDKDISEKILREAKITSRLIDPEALFKEQSALIYDVNKELESSVFGNFVPNYKTLASIARIFSDKTSPKDQVILENEIIKNMTNPSQKIITPDEIDEVVIRTFTEKFNNKYETKLLDEQKELLTYYISSFADNALELKAFLNEEIIRLKTQLKKAKNIEEIKNDSEMLKKAEQIADRLTTFSEHPIDDSVLLTVMKTQSLVKEIYSDGSIVRIGESPDDAVVRLELNVRKSMSGDLMIFDHGDIDIVLSAKNNKITAFPKETMNDLVYGAQNRLFAHLRKKGLVIADSIQGGAVYGAFEALMEEASSEELSTPKLALINISNFIDEERPYFESTEAIISMAEDELTHPDKEDSTELGEVPQRDTQGSIRRGYIRDPYSLSYLYTI